MSGFQEFLMGTNDDGMSGDKKRFKMETGQTARISIAWWPTTVVDGVTVLDMTKAPKFIAAQRHFMKGVGYFINEGPEFTKIAGEPPKLRIATIILVWPTNNKGVLDKEAIKNGSFDVVPWVLDSSKYETIKPIHEEWHLGEVDLTVKCQDAGFQKLTFSPCKNSLLRDFMSRGASAKAIVDKIVSQVQNLSANLGNEIGRKMTLDQIREKIQGGGGASMGVIGESESTDEIDGLVDDILD
jgi:hypothetical protein